MSETRRSPWATCRNCGQPILLAPGGGDPYWYHPHDGHGSIWCSGWGDPEKTAMQAEPATHPGREPAGSAP